MQLGPNSCILVAFSMYIPIVCILKIFSIYLLSLLLRFINIVLDELYHNVMRELIELYMDHLNIDQSEAKLNFVMSTYYYYITYKLFTPFYR